MSGAQYRYLALDARGGRVRGDVSATSSANAAAALQSQGLVPVHLTLSTSGAITEKLGQTLREEALTELFFSLGQLTGAGVSLPNALATMRAQSRGASARLCERIERRLAAGAGAATAFAESLGDVAGYAPALIAAGETAGDLPGAFRELAEQLRAASTLRGAFWSAVSYPLFIFIAFLASIVMLLVVVIPALAPLLEEADVSTGGALWMLLAASEVLRNGWTWIVAASGVLAIGTLTAWRLGVLRHALARMILDGPARRITRSLAYGRLSVTLGRLLSAGIPAPEAIRLATAGGSVNLVRDRLEGAVRSLFTGASVATALSACPGFPSTIAKMALLGEETGSLGVMLERAGGIEQARGIRALEQLSKVLAPALIVTMGALVGSVMALLLSTVSSLGNVVLS